MEYLSVNSLKSVASSLELLSPLVDVVARISNDLPAPKPPQQSGSKRVRSTHQYVNRLENGSVVSCHLSSVGRATA